jgi:hypothetical protein
MSLPLLLSVIQQTVATSGPPTGITTDTASPISVINTSVDGNAITQLGLTGGNPQGTGLWEILPTSTLSKVRLSSTTGLNPNLLVDGNLAVGDNGTYTVDLRYSGESLLVTPLTLTLTIKVVTPAALGAMFWNVGVQNKSNPNRIIEVNNRTELDKVMTSNWTGLTRTPTGVLGGLIPGDIVVIKNGVYTGDNFVIDCDGTRANPIRFVGDTHWGAQWQFSVDVVGEWIAVSHIRSLLTGASTRQVNFRVYGLFNRVAYCEVVNDNPWDVHSWCFAIKRGYTPNEVAGFQRIDHNKMWVTDKTVPNGGDTKMYRREALICDTGDTLDTCENGSRAPLFSLIDHNWVPQGPYRAVHDVYNSSAGHTLFTGDDIRNAMENPCTIYYMNVLERMKAGGGGDMEFKATTCMAIANNVFNDINTKKAGGLANSGMLQRQGEYGLWLGNYTEKIDGPKIEHRGRGHFSAGNKPDGALSLWAGNLDYGADAPITSDGQRYVPVDQVISVSQKSPVEVGAFYADNIVNPDMTYKARDTRIEAETHNVTLLRETGTTQVATTLAKAGTYAYNPVRLRADTASPDGGPSAPEIAASMPYAQVLDNPFAMWPDYRWHWRTIRSLTPRSGASIKQLDDGVELTAADVNGFDSTIGLYSLRPMFNDYAITFLVTRLDAGTTTTDGEAILFYDQFQGKKSRGLPIAFRNWGQAQTDPTPELPGDQFEINCVGRRHSFGQMGTASNRQQWRVRQFQGDGNQGPHIISENDQPQPGEILMTQNREYSVVLTKQGQLLTVSVTDTVSGTNKTYSKNDPMVNDSQAGYMMFRPMAHRSVRIRNFRLSLLF